MTNRTFGENIPSVPGEGTAIQQCVNEELRQYFALLKDQPPHDLYRMVMGQVESALLAHVMKECRGNQSKAATWLGISRGTLRTKLAAIAKEEQSTVV
ncbi:MAG: Fis family transcriptional regulator [Gammaproteobacteria bacterium]|nr:Fis family transcriptional regulator [Gammaproteobacteria bacterium]